MPLDTIGQLGGERVRIQFDGEESIYVEWYEIRFSFFSPPGSFAIRVGHSGLARDLLKKYPPGTSFTLWIDLPGGQSVPVMTGRIDEPSPEAGAGATEITLRGRDWMKPLHDGMPRVERTFGRTSFKDLVETLLRDAGVPDFSLLYTNADNLQAVQGIPKFETRQQPAPIVFPKEQKRLQAIQAVILGPVAYGYQLATREREMVDVQVIVGFDVPNPLKLAPGTTRWTFLRQELNRAGLFMFCGVDEKTYILTQPSTMQTPTCRITRRLGNSYGIEESRHTNNTSGRFREYIVYGRGGGGADQSRKQIKGTYMDTEMVAWDLGETWSVIDPIAKTSKQAEFLARRKAAEFRRAGWSLGYKVRGLSWPMMNAAQRAIWAIDSTVDIDDDVYDIHGPHWISEVSMRGSSNGGTTTDITMHRPADVIVGDEVLPERVQKKKKGRST